MVTQQIPVIVIAGFLGSGKTTLLNHLLRHSGGSRIGAIVNDFGSIEIDAMTVAGQVDSMLSLGNGCLCCAVDTTDMDEMLERLTRPSARIDVIVVEASGLAEPEEMIRLILSSENRRIVYGGLVEVVDAAEFTATRERHPELDRHLRVADLVVLNKADRVREDERSALLGRLETLSPGRPVVHASYGRVDPELFFDRREREDDAAGVRQLSFEDLHAEVLAAEDGGQDCDARGCQGGHGEDDGHGGRDRHLHAAYESVSFTCGDPLDPRRFMEFLDARPEGLYRIKGFVHFGVDGHRQKFAVHTVGDFLRFYPSPWERGEERTNQLVLIGTGIDAGALQDRLTTCVGTGQEKAGPESMWGVLRYTQDHTA
ncbi:CobW family GTP-binding protein [Streptomyces sp. NPDC047108]|uniref:CobW family GTP-binding protein n=1 Tax=Streptomyces sp. NPDC047108 TaxID=3155025 RepID=UPI0033E7C66B